MQEFICNGKYAVCLEEFFPFSLETVQIGIKFL